jgi:outer membrane protein assembly factor BamB
MIAMAAIFRIDRVDGRLVPSLRFRWTPKPDQLLEAPVIADAEADIDLGESEDKYAFPQFLGPDRNLIINSVQLDQDWESNAPQEMWRQPIGAGWSGFSAVNGFAFTMEQRGPHELVTCYEVETGTPRWSHSVNARHETVLGGVGPRCTPTVHRGKVYALGATGILRCIDGTTGKLVWSDDILARYGVTPKQDLNAVSWGRAASPLIVDDLLIVPFGGPAGGPCHSLAAYDAESGELRWKGGTEQVSYSSPTLTTLVGKRQIVIVNESSVSGHVPETGELLWSHPWSGSSTSSASASQAVPLPDDRILLSKGYGRGAELIQIEPGNDSQLKASTLWDNSRVLKTKFTNVVVLGDEIFGLSDGILECVRLSDGGRLWKDRRRADLEHGQLLSVGDVLLAQAESGDVVMFEPHPLEYRELGRFTALSDQTWNNLCLYGPYLLTRNSVEAACFKLPVLEEVEQADREKDDANASEAQPAND